MGEKELIVFIILINSILFIFIIGIILFIYHYRKRKILYSKELLSVKNEHTKAILNAKLESQEQTMMIIGNDIHDSVGQKLTLASLYLQRVSMKNLETIRKENLLEINEMINESLIELRLLSKSLVNPNTAQINLSDLIRLDIKRIEELNPIKISFLQKGEIFDMDALAKNNLYKIVQEFFQNSIKHSNCRTIDVELYFDNPMYIIKIKDDGKGFDFENVTKGIGLTNIKRRSNELKAILKFTSSAEEGTQLNLNGEC